MLKAVAAFAIGENFVILGCRKHYVYNARII